MDLVEFIKEKRKYHRILFFGPINNRKEKDTFTVLDFYNYFILSTVGVKESQGLNNLSKEERLSLTESILTQYGNLKKVDEDFIIDICRSYGLQQCLFAIDDIMIDDLKPNELPPLSIIRDTITSGVVYVSSLLREDVE